MQRQLRFTDESDAQLQALAIDPAKKALHKQVLKTLGLLEIDSRIPACTRTSITRSPQDADAARKICDALRAAGVEVVTALHVTTTEDANDAMP